jgi:cytochrome c-type biogenesis protein
MEFFFSLVENSDYAIVTAFVLGLMTAVSPCPLATNISAIGFISSDISDRRKVFYSGLAYTAGRAASYTALGLILFSGASQMDVSAIFQGWGEKLLAPVMIIIGLFMLGVLSFRLPGMGKFTDRMEALGKKGYWGAFLLGAAFALAFCPYSGVLYFGMLVPITISSPSGLMLPAVFALATGAPVIIFAWLLAFAVGNVGKMYESVRKFELWFRRIVGVTFITFGLYFVYVFYI